MFTRLEDTSNPPTVNEPALLHCTMMIYRQLNKLIVTGKAYLDTTGSTPAATLATAGFSRSHRIGLELVFLSDNAAPEDVITVHQLHHLMVRAYRQYSPRESFLYACKILRRRWPEAEACIQQDPEIWKQYKTHFKIVDQSSS